MLNWKTNIWYFIYRSYGICFGTSSNTE